MPRGTGERGGEVRAWARRQVAEMLDKVTAVVSPSHGGETTVAPGCTGVKTLGSATLYTTRRPATRFVNSKRVRYPLRVASGVQRKPGVGPAAGESTVGRGILFSSAAARPGHLVRRMVLFLFAPLQSRPPHSSLHR